MVDASPAVQPRVRISGMRPATLALAALLAWEGLAVAAGLSVVGAEGGGAGPVSTSVTAVGAFVLLMSAVTWSTALDALTRNQPGAERFWRLATIGLGVAFLVLQAAALLEWTGSDAALGGHAAVLGVGCLHALQLSVAILWLLRLGSAGRPAAANRELVARLAGTHWHFVTLSWIVAVSFIHWATPLARITPQP